jgi:hypothetical protein
MGEFPRKADGRRIFTPEFKREKGVPSQGSAYQFKITLKEVRPTIWRRIQVPEAYSFWDLHVAIQDAMGWRDCHLHLFRLGGARSRRQVEIGIPGDESVADEAECLPGWETPLSSHFRRVGDRAEYEYDFGDGWLHEVLLEEIPVLNADKRYPLCLAGARACPPEDCGGASGFADLLEIVGDPTHEEHAGTMEWLGGSFDPGAFDPRRVTFDNPSERLTTLFESR